MLYVVNERADQRLSKCPRLGQGRNEMMDETILGSVPNTPMTKEQRAAHRRLARAEKTLIMHIVWEHDEHVIQRAQALCKRRTAEWKKVCA